MGDLWCTWRCEMWWCARTLALSVTMATEVSSKLLSIPSTVRCLRAPVSTRVRSAAAIHKLHDCGLADDDVERGQYKHSGALLRGDVAVDLHDVSRDTRCGRSVPG
jgi:hypothetical protein